MKQKPAPSSFGSDSPFAASLAFLGIEQKPRLKVIDPEATLRSLVARNGGTPESPAQVFGAVVGEYLSDDERTASERSRSMPIVGRDREADEIIDTLVRIKGKAPVLIAPPGSKSTIARRAVQRTLAGVTVSYEVRADPVSHDVNLVIRLERR